MNSAKPWIKALEVSDSTYKKWMAEAPKAESFTFWCLKTEKISDKDYLGWARDYYGLASIDPEFFKNAPDLKFWSNIKTVANWSEKMIPVLEWDGVIFIACVEPMSDVNWSFPVCYVLAESKNLNQYWQHLQAETSTQQSGATKAQSKVAAQEPAPTSVAQATPSHIPPIPTPLVIEEKSFVGMPPIPELQLLDNPSEQTSTQNDPKAAQSKKIEQPEGLILDMPNWNAEEVATPETANHLQLVKAEATPTTKNNSTEKEEVVEPPAILKLNQNEAPPVTPTVASINQNESKEAVNHNVQFSGFLNHIKNNFTAGMILKVENEFVKAHAWDEGFKVVEANATGFWSLNPASAFRVATRSKMPYLGHIVETPANIQFFTAWGFKNLPSSILLQPILAEGKVAYLILAVSQTEKKNFELMSLGEKLVENFMTLFPSLSKSA